MLIFQGLPFGRELSASEMLTASDAHDIAYDRSTSFGFSTTIIPLLFWLSTYILSVVQVLRTDYEKFMICMRKSFALSLYLVLMLLDLMFSSAKSIVFINIIHYVGCIFLCFSASQFCYDNVQDILKSLTKTFFIIVFINVGFYLLYPEYGVSYDGRVKGITGNPNSLGMLSSLAAWTALVSFLWESRFRNRSFYFLFFLFASALLYLTESMTSVVSMACATIVLFWISFGAIKPKINLLRAVFLSAIPILLLVAGYLSEMMRIVGSQVGRTGDFSGRASHWIDALRLISMKPVIGWGFDNNASAIRESGLSTSHFHDGYLDVAVRSGLVGVVLLFIFLVRFSSPFRIYNKKVVVLICSFFAYMYFYNITEVTYFSNRNEMWLIALFLYFYRERFVLRSL